MQPAKSDRPAQSNVSDLLAFALIVVFVGIIAWIDTAYCEPEWVRADVNQPAKIKRITPEHPGELTGD